MLVERPGLDPWVPVTVAPDFGSRMVAATQTYRTLSIGFRTTGIRHLREFVRPSGESGD